MALSVSYSQVEKTDSSEWISLFNGKNLDGWTVKINGHPINENIHNTFSAEDGILKVSYDDYEKFDMQFGHIFTNISYSHYIFRVDYKIFGSGMPDAPHWANLNSGVMLHSQSPQSMRIDQGFPVSLEGQFLAEGATAGTQTGNAVTPGTHIEMDGKLIKEHVVDSNSELFPLDTWVTFEAEVHGNEEIIHRVNGKEVIRYAHPQLDETDKDAKRLLDLGVNKNVCRGFIALQAEGQPIWFRNIQIKILKDK
ncbi:MAG: DUF1080 domain-containing protein [Melioribacteraceae bacterium]|nr:DUF1080 domain-containing protein [Melioribacteraceae bacterium]